MRRVRNLEPVGGGYNYQSERSTAIRGLYRNRAFYPITDSSYMSYSISF